PLAGVCIDSVGLRPELCGGTLEWHATIPPSAGFVDALGEKVIRSTLRNSRTGYRFKAAKFVSTDDTLIGDPKYGFPCPWFSTGLYDGYHSSADTPRLLHAPGLAGAAASMAGYLYYLADMATTEALEVAEWRTAETLAALRALGRRPQRADVEFLRARHAEDVRRLSRWLWDGEHSEARGRLLDCERRVSSAAGRPARARAADRAPRVQRVPRRTAPIIPTLENVPADLCGDLAPLRWAHYYADGKRSIADIARLVSGEWRREIPAKQLARGFDALEKLGFVEIADPADAVGHAELVRGLKRLGLRRGMDLMVHSAMSAIGHVDGGADTVVDAILETVGPRATVMVPSFNHGAARVYNPLVTPCKSGAIPEAFWRRPEAVRSVHPTHPVAAIGPKAAEWCAGHVEAGVWGEDSPIGRLIRDGGFILNIAVGHGSSTAHHVAEVATGKCIDQFAGRGRVVDADGRVRQVSSLAWRNGKCPISPAKLEGALARRGLRRKGKLGAAEATLVLARDLYSVRRQHLRRACPGCKVRPEDAAKTARRRGGT
ncbi:MAG: AAC(3) family N-acetyltransferase, partial [Planctomycetota bacterium]